MFFFLPEKQFRRIGENAELAGFNKSAIAYLLVITQFLV